MTHGRNICNQLKAVRKRIAEENGIDLEIPECTYHGECRGTCPRCEAEVRFLENTLADRLRLGKVATVAGLALGLASPSIAAAQDTIRPTKETTVIECDEPLRPLFTSTKKTKNIIISGQVVDSTTGEPLPFVHVIINEGDRQVRGTSTDFDGVYRLKIPRGTYTITFRGVGYIEQTVRETNYTEDTVMPPIKFAPHSDLEERPAQKHLPITIGPYYTGGLVSEEPVAIGFPPTRDSLPPAPPAPPQVVLSMDEKTEEITLSGQVVDSVTGDPLPFANVIINEGDRQVKVAPTDFDGIYRVSIPKGTYTIAVLTVGYKEKTVQETNYTEDAVLPTIKLSSNGGFLESVIITGEYNPFLPNGPYSPTQRMEINGVNVIVQ